MYVVPIKIFEKKKYTKIRISCILTIKQFNKKNLCFCSINFIFFINLKKK